MTRTRLTVLLGIIALASECYSLSLRQKIEQRAAADKGGYWRTDAYAVTGDPEIKENEEIYDQKKVEIRQNEQDNEMQQLATKVDHMMEEPVSVAESRGYFPHQSYTQSERPLPKLTPGSSCVSLGSCDACVKDGICMWTKDGGCKADRDPTSHPFGTRDCDNQVSENDVKYGVGTVPRNEKNTELDDYMQFLHGKDSFYYTAVPDNELHKSTKNTAIATLGYGQDMYTQAKDLNDKSSAPIARGLGTDIVDGAPGGYIDLTGVSSIHGKVGEYNREISKVSTQPKVEEAGVISIPM